MVEHRMHHALRVVSAHKRGSSWPVVVETAAGRFLTKLRGAAQGTAPLVAEVVVAELADALGLRVPRRVLVRLDEDVECADRDAELAHLLAASRGVNLGFRFLEDAREIRADEVEAADDDLACRVLWLDALVLNPDRRPRNPNVLIAEGQAWLVDHGASLPFQYRWAAVTEDAPRRETYPIDRHLFGRRARRLTAWDEPLAARLDRETLDAAVSRVPDVFLRPLLPREDDDRALERRRQAYVAYLWKRLKAPRPFVPAAPLRAGRSES
jgi:hypothetical protein